MTKNDEVTVRVAPLNYTREEVDILKKRFGAKTVRDLSLSLAGYLEAHLVDVIDDGYRDMERNDRQQEE
jgi:hypothetical protein